MRLLNALLTSNFLNFPDQLFGAGRPTLTEWPRFLIDMQCILWTKISVLDHFSAREVQQMCSIHGLIHLQFASNFTSHCKIL